MPVIVHQLPAKVKQIGSCARLLQSRIGLAPFRGSCTAAGPGHELQLSPETRYLLRSERQRRTRHGLSTTKPGSLLKQAIPIRTFADWDDKRAGFEVDWVAHCDDDTSDEYLHTPVLTDVATAWTEVVALPNRGQKAVSEAIQVARARLPFPLLGLDSDNGGEFINDNLARYCKREGISFTRSRPYKKNDQAYVEQKNWTVVRQMVGYDRYEGPQAGAQLEALYDVLRPYVNFLQPAMKLTSKERFGKVAKNIMSPGHALRACPGCTRGAW